MSSFKSRATSLGLHAMIGAGAVTAVAIDRRLRPHTRHSADISFAAVTLSLYGVYRTLERRIPFKEEWLKDHNDYVPDSVFNLSSVTSVPVSKAITHFVPTRQKGGVANLPDPVAVAIGVLAYDFFHYWLHRLGHEWGPAWKLHSVHHSAKRLYWFNALRFHVGETYIDQIGEQLIVKALGMSEDQHVAYLSLRGAYGQFQHANIEVSSGVLDRVFSTPDLHRWHHSTIYSEGDTNYGAITSLWDQVFGSFYRPKRAFDSDVGVGRMPDFPESWIELQQAPLHWDQIRERNAATWYAEDELDTR